MTLSTDDPDDLGEVGSERPAPDRTRLSEFGPVAQEVLNECVRTVTGRDDIAPRTGQSRLMNDLIAAMCQTVTSDREIGGQVTAEAGTGVGKSFAYLVPTMVARALLGERSVVSTEMISLQTQIIDKDAPVVADAVAKVTGYRPEVALLKGWSNYSCAAQAVEAAEALTGTAPSKHGHDAIVQMRERVAERRAEVEPKRNADGSIDTVAVLAAVSAAQKRSRTGRKSAGGGVVTAEERERLALVEWALDEAASLGEARADGTGDKNAYTGSLNDSRSWDAVSLSSSDCPGAQKCPFADSCLPRLARAQAADADVVVTNHHLLAVQAAKAVPVVLGSKTLGDFGHLIIDEAHGLPSIVRDQGSVEVSSRVLRRVAKSLTRIMDETDPAVLRCLDDAEGIAKRLDEELDEWIAQIKRYETVARLTAEDDPVNDTAGLIARWISTTRAQVKTAEGRTANESMHRKARRIRNSLDALSEAVSKVAEHEVGSARWVETVRPHPKAADQRTFPAAFYTPVEVAPMLRYNLWTVEDTEAVEAQADQHEGDGPPPRLSLTVAALSATLPKGFGAQMGMRTQIVGYESPFDDAYDASVLFVPRAAAGSADVDALRKDFGDKPKFDTTKHADWAVGHAINLIEANGGSALVLSATASAGRLYAQRLAAAAAGRWRVLSQWDGPPLRKQVADWKEEESAVLVGTKSLMTGIDPAGSTCTLVIVDRPARARSNPVDDARVEGVMERAGIDKWSADRLVYVADAGALLRQAAGRLIRQVSDSGMVAVLDPRLLKSGPLAYPHATRTEYLAALDKFEVKIADAGSAAEWLRRHRAALGDQASA